MKKTNSIVISILLIFTILFTGCASKSEKSSNQSTKNSETYYYDIKQEAIDGRATNSASLDTAGTYLEFEASALLEPFAPNNDNEEYTNIQENIFMNASINPLSTFGADVDTASYANLRRYISTGEIPPTDAIRIEEMLNYFSYQYAEPDANEPFSVTTEIYPCPWNKDTVLAQIGLQAKKVDTSNLPPQNLVFLIDVSGSMNSYDKLDLVKRAFLLLCEELRECDTISIVTYASSDAVVLEGVSGIESTTIMNAIENLSSGGSTAGSKGITTAYQIAEKYYKEDGNNRVILATDGDLNVGLTSESALKKLITEKKKSGVFLSVMGFGTENIKDNKMETLADKGNGNYSYIDSIYEARKVLVEEIGSTLLTVAKDVKLQVEFNPSKVKGYRLIGYENRLMNAEDFADDTKDGGELGSGHRVTALYEIALSDSAMEIPEIDMKYQSTSFIESDDLFTINIRYKEPTADTSTLLSYPVGEVMASTMSDNMKLASSIAQVGMLLRNSVYRGTANYNDILETLSSISSLEEDKYIYEFKTMVEKINQILN